MSETKPKKKGGKQKGAGRPKGSKNKIDAVGAVFDAIRTLRKIMRHGRQAYDPATGLPLKDADGKLVKHEPNAADFNALRGFLAMRLNIGNLLKDLQSGKLQFGSVDEEAIWRAKEAERRGLTSEFYHGPIDDGP